jgi:hypothetical protein
MSKQTIWQETEYHDVDLMMVVRRLMCGGVTGQIILNCSQGRVLSVTHREKKVVSIKQEKSLDRDVRTDSKCEPLAVARS